MRYCGRRNCVENVQNPRLRSWVAPTTTTTTLPSGEGCTSGCDDGDPCTDDLCVQQLCTNVPMMGYDSAICEVGELVQKPLCGEEVLPSKYQRQTAEKVQKTQRWLRKAAASGKPRQVGKLLLRVDRALRAIETKAGKLARRGRLSGDCDQTIKRLVDERRQLVVGLAT